MSAWWMNQGPYVSQQYYDQLHTTQVKLKLNDRTDKDILEWIRQKKQDPDTSIQGEIKRLIREDIEKNSGCTPNPDSSAIPQAY